MKLHSLLSSAHIECPKSLLDIEISNIVTNSNFIEHGSLFVCIKGVNFDSHTLIREAILHGASAVVVDSDVSGFYDLPIIRVENTRVAMARLYAAFYGNPQDKLKFIGITGTNGKTTTAKMLYEILKYAGISVGLIGTIGCISTSGKLDIRSGNRLANMTTPDPCELYKILSVMVEDKVEYVIMEVTSHALALHKVEPIEFDFALFTNLTQDHLDFHGDMESYYLAKRSLFDRCRRAIINCDNIYGRRLCCELDYPLTCTQEGRIATFSATEIKYNGYSGLEYKLNSRILRLRVRTQIPGNFTVMNSLMAIACAAEIGVSAHTIRKAMMSISGTDGRLQRVELGHKANFAVFIDYAHTPDALENLICSARGFISRGSKLVVLFGCGGERDREKRRIMGHIASTLADMTIITSDNPRSENPDDIICDILKGVNKESRYVVIPDRRSAIKYAVENAAPGDVILLAGKGHETYEIVGNEKRDFSEKQIVLEAYSKRVRPQR